MNAEIAVNLGILSYYRALAEFQPRLRVACLRTAIAELVDVLCQRKRLYRAYLFVAKASVRLAAERSGAVAQKAFQIALAHMEALARMDAPSPIWLAHWPPLLRDAFEVLADKLVVGVDDAEGEIFRRQTLFHPLLDELEEVAEAVETIFARVGNAALRHTTQTFFAEWRNFFIVRMQASKRPGVCCGIADCSCIVGCSLLRCFVACCCWSHLAMVSSCCSRRPGETIECLFARA